MKGIFRNRRSRYPIRDINKLKEDVSFVEFLESTGCRIYSQPFGADDVFVLPDGTQYNICILQDNESYIEECNILYDRWKKKRRKNDNKKSNK